MKLYIKEGFYNPKGELARKLGVLAFLASSSDDVFEAFAGSGVRTVMYGVLEGQEKFGLTRETGGSYASLRRTF